MEHAVKDYFMMAVVFAMSVLLLLFSVKKSRIRAALFAFFVAQLFSWPLTLLYVQFGLQHNPVRLFPHATESNFLFAFIFQPSVFTAYYLRYPKKARKSARIFYTVVIITILLVFLFSISRFTSLIYYPSPLVPFGSFPLILFLYHISRLYIDRYFRKYFTPKAD